MPYTVAELEARFRREMDDEAAPYLYAATTVYEYLDSAQKQFARLTDCLAATATATVTANDPWVVISERWTKLRRATLRATQRKLEILNYADLDEQVFEDDYGQTFEFSPGWEDLTGSPQFLVLDMEQNKGRLTPYLPVDATADVLDLLVYREPTTDVTGTASVLEITNNEDQRALVLWMRHLGYGKHDAETYDARLEASFETRFLSYCAEAKSRFARLRRRAGTVRYGGL